MLIAGETCLEPFADKKKTAYVKIAENIAINREIPFVPPTGIFFWWNLICG